ncbi:MAG: site-2 protease family protein [Candidatus Thermoplasmatota archaeon]
MTLIESLNIFIIVIFFYILIVGILQKKGVLKKYNLSLYGPIIMWRTMRGLKTLKRISNKKKLWLAYGNIGIVTCFIVMILMTLLLILMSWFYIGLTPEQTEALPGLETAFVIPVINPILPLEYLGYVVLALVIAMVAHEFSHGILSFVSSLKVKSLGLLYFIVPLGAFCEPDEEEIKNTSIPNRMRIFSAGPLSNFIIVITSMLLLSGLLIVSIQPTTGAIIHSVDSDTPAETIGLQPGCIITSLNNTVITNGSDFFKVLKGLRSNQTVNIAFIKKGVIHNTSIWLNDTYIELTKKGYIVNESYKNTSYIAVYILSDKVHHDYLSSLKNPFSRFPYGFINLYSIPVIGYLQGYNPITSPFIDTYILTGPAGIIPAEIFWVIVNALYWIFWLNFAVAIFNVLPAIPLDGGYLFRDGLTILIKRVKPDIPKEKSEKTVSRISLTISLCIFFIIFLPFIIKYFYMLT